MIFKVYDYIASSAHYFFISERLAYKQPEKLTSGGSLGIIDVAMNLSNVSLF